MSFISEIDTTRFGFNIAKVDAWSDDISQTLNKLRSDNVKLVISKVHTDKLTLLNTLEQHGFHVKDIQLTYKYTFNRELPSIDEYSNQLIIRDFQEQDLSAVASIAHHCFLDYGHYFADARLDRSKCEEIYKDWAIRCCLDKNFADKTLVAVHNNRIVGFTAFKTHSSSATKYVTANISGVASDQRGLGIYQKLMVTALHYFAKQNIEWVEGNALSVNYPVIYSLPKIGYKMVNSFCTLHGWLD